MFVGLVAMPNWSRSVVPSPDDFLTVIRSESSIAITSERWFSRNDNSHASQSALHGRVRRGRTQSRIELVHIEPK